MIPGLAVVALVPVVCAAVSGALLWRSGVARISAVALIAISVVGGTAVAVDVGGELPGDVVMAALVLLIPVALWAYPRPRWRHLVDFVLSVLVLAPGVVALLRPNEDTVFLMAVTAILALVAQGWWRLEREEEPWRGALVWSGLSSAGAVVFGWTISFAGNEDPWSVAAVLLAFATVPVAMAVGVLRPQAVDPRGLVAQVAVFLVLGVGYLAAYAGAVATAEVLGVEQLAPAVPALLAFALALGVHPAAVRLRGTMDQMLFGDRPDPWRAASAAVSTMGDDPRVALLSVREAMALPYLAIERTGSVLVESGTPVAHTRRLRLESTPGASAELVVGLRPGDLRLPDGDARALALVAPLVVALTHAEELARGLQSSRRETVEMVADERLRLRRELHDGLGPLLTGIAFATDAARNTLRSDPDRASDTLSQARQDTAEAISLIRSVVYGMRPPALDEVGLVPALQQQALTLRRSDGSPMPTEFLVGEPLPPLPAAVEVAAYRIVVEGLTNAARHVPSAVVTVRLGVEEDALVVEIRDDGTSRAAWSAGVGLTSMRERAAELGGTVSWGPDETGGLICAVLPLGTATR